MPLFWSLLFVDHAPLLPLPVLLSQHSRGYGVWQPVTNTRPIAQTVAEAAFGLASYAVTSETGVTEVGWSS